MLGAFADSFDYAGLRIDQALRLYLETFRLPGEAPLIFLVMERFAERWHVSIVVAFDRVREDLGIFRSFFSALLNLKICIFVHSFSNCLILLPGANISVKPSIGSILKISVITL